MVAFRSVELFVSEEVLAEYREVFSRPKFAQIPGAEVATLLALIEKEATMVAPTERLAISGHDSDNRFYECAAAAGADYIVTGNTRHFSKPSKNTKVINGRQLLELLTAGSAKNRPHECRHLGRLTIGRIVPTCQLQVALKPSA